MIMATLCGAEFLFDLDGVLVESRAVVVSATPSHFRIAADTPRRRNQRRRGTRKPVPDADRLPHGIQEA